MAEPLKNQFGIEIPKKIAAMIVPIFPEFNVRAFLDEALDGYLELELTPRAARIADSLRSHLPADYRSAISILLQSLGPTLDEEKNPGMGAFLYLPHVLFVSKYGLDDFETSMGAQYELTQRFTAEFSIRAFLETHRDTTLERLAEWANDPSEHVRRLVSEGTRPRLPWAPRLREFQKNPGPVLELLELLKDDPSLYVRRSVANNLNDIGKDHPSILVETARRWLDDADPNRRWLVRHGLRSAIKRADSEALSILGYQANVETTVVDIHVTPESPRIGDTLWINVGLINEGSRQHKFMIDLRIHFVKANSTTSPKVFKMKAAEIGPNELVQLRKSISLRDMTTRTHFPGVHRIDLIVNGRTRKLADFDLRSS